MKLLISGETVEISGETAEISGEIVEISGETVEISGETVEISGETVEISGETVKTYGRGVSKPSCHPKMSGEISIVKLLIDILSSFHCKFESKKKTMSLCPKRKGRFSIDPIPIPNFVM